MQGDRRVQGRLVQKAFFPSLIESTITVQDSSENKAFLGSLLLSFFSFLPSLQKLLTGRVYGRKYRVIFFFFFHVSRFQQLEPKSDHHFQQLLFHSIQVAFWACQCFVDSICWSNAFPRNPLFYGFLSTLLITSCQIIAYLSAHANRVPAYLILPPLFFFFVHFICFQSNVFYSCHKNSTNSKTSFTV